MPGTAWFGKLRLRLLNGIARPKAGLKPVRPGISRLLAHFKSDSLAPDDSSSPYAAGTGARRFACVARLLFVSAIPAEVASSAAGRCRAKSRRAPRQVPRRGASVCTRHKPRRASAIHSVGEHSFAPLFLSRRPFGLSTKHFRPTANCVSRRTKSAKFRLAIQPSPAV
jgi:hypothetical protein